MKTDIEIKKEVMDELGWIPSINETNIGVAVKDGIVTLSGSVDSYFEKISAEDAALRISGVKAVANEINVKLPGTSERSDEDIARVAVNALKWDTLVPYDRIKVTVEKGRVTLRGDVNWRYQKEAAEKVVCNLWGVRAVCNEIAVKPKVKSEDIMAKISSALQRSAMLDANRITVETIGSKVILQGSVRSWIEKQEADKAAWAAPGVCEVENKITVNP
ncbi:MAG: BON domain-containing protein [Methanothrix sp.]|nr:BON domain-containing protein [Methanothrix sp.]